MDGGATRGLPAGGRPPEEGRPGEVEAAVVHLERLCGRLEQAEQHFKRLTDECENVLQGLVAVDRRHSAAIASLNERLGDWCNLEGKLLEESARRIERFERGVSHEWMVLRRLNEEPIAELRSQAEALSRTCLEAARVARLRIEAAEQAHASHADEVERRLEEWTRQLLEARRSAVDRPAGGPPRPEDASPGVEPWSFEGVAQLHQEVRGGAAAEAAPPGEASGRGVVAKAESLERPEGAPEERPGQGEAEPAGGRGRGWMLALGGAGLVALLALLLVTSGGPGTPPAVAGPNPAVSPSPPAPVVPAVAADPDPRLVEAQLAAERATAMVDILAAPDLYRYALRGVGATPRAYAQVLWSRTRGMAVTAGRLPAPPPGSTYRVWIGGASATASAGPLAPDASGRASLVVPGPLAQPRPGTVTVTIEPLAGSPQPTGEPCLSRGPGA